MKRPDIDAIRERVEDFYASCWGKPGTWEAERWAYESEKYWDEILAYVEWLEAKVESDAEALHYLR